MTTPGWPTNSDTSATGGYILPSAPGALPGGLTFEEFLQTVFVGVSGLPGDMVRPAWQISPPKQPDAYTNWMKLAVTEIDADYNSYTQGVLQDGSNQTMRMEQFIVQCSFYGPQASEYMKLVRDNFQVKQNLEALQGAYMNFVATGKATHVPDLVNELWINRWEMSVTMRREIIRVYPILTFVSGSGSLIANTAAGTKTIQIPISEG